MSAEIPENVRQVLDHVARVAADGADVENAHPGESDRFVIGYQRGALDAVVVLVESVLADPELSWSEHMELHWAAVDRRRAERSATAAAPGDAEQCKQCGAHGAHRLGCRRTGGAYVLAQRRSRWEGARRKLGMTTTDADWEAYVADDGEPDGPEAHYEWEQGR